MSKEASGAPRRRKALDGLRSIIQTVGTPPGHKNSVRLSHNESPYGSALQAQQAYLSAAHSISIYGDGQQVALRREISRTHTIPIEDIICGNGSDELISLLLRAYLDGSGEIVLSENGFVMTRTHATATGAKIVSVSETNWRIDADAVLAAISEQTRIVSICNPNNPGGTFLDRSTLKSFINSIPRHIIVHIDEAYAEYAASEPEYQSVLLWKVRPPNVVVTRTFSKAYGLAGLRIGWLAGSMSIIETIDRLRTPFNANSPALAAATAAVKCQDWLQQVVRDNRIVRDRFVSTLDSVDVEIIPSVTNFVLLRFPIERGKSGREAYEALESEGYLAALVGTDDAHLRISIGTDPQMREVARIIISYLGKVVL